jgi:hypothetical protein
MKSGEEFLKNLLNMLMPNRAAPVLGRVIKSYEGPGKNKYSVDVRVLKAGTLEETDRVISEVPLSPIWATKKKRGVYAIPNEDQVVIVEFLSWNPAYPYVSGIWSDEYEAGEFGKDQFVITDGDGMKFIIDANDGSILLDNGKGSIVKIEKDKITVDNKQFQIILNNGKVSIKNGSKSLFTILDKILQDIISMKTNGSPALHVVSPDTITKLTTDKTDLAILMEA